MKSELKSERLLIGGMSCSVCETKIENKLKKLPGVLKCKAFYSSSDVKITYDTSKVDRETIIDTIEKMEYEVKDEAEGKILSKNDDGKLSVKGFIGIGVIGLAVYFTIQNTVGFNFIPEVNSSMGYWILFTVGLLTSLHCVAMCGGINLSQCVVYNSKSDVLGNSVFSKLKPSILYNSGRVIAYTVIGGIVGAIGSVVSFSGIAKGMVVIAAGVFMIIMGLNMLDVFPWLRKINPRMPKIFMLATRKIFRKMQDLIDLIGSKFEFLGQEQNGKTLNKEKTGKGPLVVGLLNGLMPCGPLQAMQIFALGTGSFTKGALSMFFFSLGTVPLMFGLGTLGSFLGSKFTYKMMKVSCVLIMLLGVITVSRGFAIFGIGLPSFDNKTNDVAIIDGGVQLVSTKLNAYEYTPIVVQKGIPVKWTITAENSDLNGCNNPLTIPKFNILKKLVPGENIIEFTPNEEGNIVYTCHMGMISSNIRVVGDVSKISGADEKGSINPVVSESTGTSSLGGCCATGGNATKSQTDVIPTVSEQTGAPLLGGCCATSGNATKSQTDVIRTDKSATGGCCGQK